MSGGSSVVLFSAGNPRSTLATERSSRNAAPSAKRFDALAIARAIEVVGLEPRGDALDRVDQERAKTGLVQAEVDLGDIEQRAEELGELRRGQSAECRRDRLRQLLTGSGTVSKAAIGVSGTASANRCRSGWTRPSSRASAALKRGANSEVSSSRPADEFLFHDGRRATTRGDLLREPRQEVQQAPTGRVSASAGDACRSCGRSRTEPSGMACPTPAPLGASC